MSLSPNTFRLLDILVVSKGGLPHWRFGSENLAAPIEALAEQRNVEHTGCQRIHSLRSRSAIDDHIQTDAVRPARLKLIGGEGGGSPSVRAKSTADGRRALTSTRATPQWLKELK